MKKFLIITICVVVVILAFTSIQAYASSDVPSGKFDKTPEAVETPKAGQQSAEKSEGKGGKRVNEKGVIASLSTNSLTITLKDGGSQTFSVDAMTRIKVPSQKGSTMRDLHLGAQVMVHAVKGQGNTLTALQIMVIPGKPAQIHRVGTVTQYKAGVSITINALQDSKPYTFTLTADTKILPKERAEKLAVGSKVTIITSRNVTGGSPVAKGIVVHPANGEKDSD